MERVCEFPPSLFLNNLWRRRSTALEGCVKTPASACLAALPSSMWGEAAWGVKEDKTE